jgi:DNA-binding CsgD family transcriptional regulator/PAS domain-containing protein
MACDFPLLVWELPADVVRLANDAAAELFSLPLDRLVGSKGFDLGGPRPAVERTVAALDSGAVDDVLAERWIRGPDGQPVAVKVWSRILDLDGQRAAVSLMVPVSEAGRLGRDPAAPWRELAPVAVGTADREWRIQRVSTDITRVLGREPTEIVGSSLLALVDPDDVPVVSAAASDEARSIRHVRFRHGDASWVELTLLVAPLSNELQGPSLAFALVGAPCPPADGSAADRVAELEMRLRDIGAQVRAAGVLDEVEALPAVSDYPQLGELTSRQWEILSRLLRGDRVATIAADLYVSPSTVRNHLATIFAKFGVHSQADLLALLRRPPGDGPRV